MTILDKNLELDPPLSAITVSRASTNAIGFPAAADLANGTPIRILCAVDVPFTAGGAATLQITLRGAPDNGGVPGAFTDYALSPVIALANLTAGKKLVGFDLPRKPPGVEFAALPAWYELFYTVATGPFTAGSVFAYLDLGNDEQVAYPSGFSVSP